MKGEREGERERECQNGRELFLTLPETLLYIESVIYSQWSHIGSVCSHMWGICTTCLRHVGVVCT